ncbi:hypothetical protein A2997_01165 [Candidatus Nomurabacteria bacterium RIFCSPLOWO2_01_FULL_36_10b]|uniref:Uncharacterized protein n=1 Tax=Candidatus Nomurabacteria bacterium RIFCSPLOWO2_01_FULL_36_10b TaxID=1801766 RepID=A0A1F6WQD5_9BACT|nr:MAG: hypothetical protein A2997_01165 [Candidatus Nomurabacteria bacterium RIFCSPLOWO2_01_FULL_36_10b]
MLILFIIFIGSLAIVGVMIGWKLVTLPKHPSEQATNFHSAPFLFRHHDEPIIDLITLQKNIWRYVFYYLREILILIIVYPLLGVEQLSRFLSKHIHYFIEQTLGYHHTHIKH